MREAMMGLHRQTEIAETTSAPGRLNCQFTHSPQEAKEGTWGRRMRNTTEAIAQKKKATQIDSVVLVAPKNSFTPNPGKDAKGSIFIAANCSHHCYMGDWAWSSVKNSGGD